MKRLLDLFARTRLTLDNEKSMQQSIADMLTAAGIEFKREVKVAGGVIDFVVNGIGIEAKIKGQKRAVHRQVCGYAMDQTLHSIILVTNMPMTLPKMINGRPITVVNVGEAWL